MPSLTVSHVSKSFPSAGGPHHVLRDVSFELPEGGILCLVGPNGSGKTTLLKTIATLLSPEEGAVRLDGVDLHAHPDRAKRLIGFASSEDHSFYGRLSVRRNLWFYAQLHGLSGAEWARRLDELSRQLDLPPLDAPFRELSSGQKQRLLLARALLHDPPVLLLDEPQQNMDPIAAMRLRALLAEEWVGRARKTVLLSTHHLEDARRVADRWVVLAEGRVRFDGSIRDHGSGGFDAETFFRRLTDAPAHAG